MSQIFCVFHSLRLILSPTLSRLTSDKESLSWAEHRVFLPNRFSLQDLHWFPLKRCYMRFSWGKGFLTRRPWAFPDVNCRTPSATTRTTYTVFARSPLSLLQTPFSRSLRSTICDPSRGIPIPIQWERFGLQMADLSERKNKNGVWFGR